MGARGEALAVQFEQANMLLAETIEALADDRWGAQCAGEGWTVGVTVHHIATNHRIVLGLAQMAAEGASLPAITVEEMNQGNEERARQCSGCSKGETLALLRAANSDCAAGIRALTDVQLQRTVPMPRGTMTVAEIIEQIMTGHVAGPFGHLQSIRTAG